MTKKLLFLLDTDPVPSVFDTVVGYDGGADRVIGYGGVTPENVLALVDGTIYTRGPKEKQFTAIFVGGGSMTAGEAVFEAVKKRFFANFRVSAMLDSNGSNTTAAAGVALLAKAKPLNGKKSVVLAGTGPVGMRAAAMLHIEGAEVAITSRSKQRADAAAKAIKDRFGFLPAPIAAHALSCTLVGAGKALRNQAATAGWKFAGSMGRKLEQRCIYVQYRARRRRGSAIGGASVEAPDAARRRRPGSRRYGYPATLRRSKRS